ncbi:CLAVATA3/ESR [Hirschfeldia incana]|nr:CLAVATA3/ESR [Hirschfeldia incana]
MLGSSSRMMLLVLVCIGLLSDNRYKVSALKNKELFLRQTQGDKAGVHPGEIAKLRSIYKNNREDQVILSRNRRFLEEVKKNTVKPGKTQEPNNSFQSSKRRVRRGSDPIHNKSEPFS